MTDTAPGRESTRVVIGGVGYRNLRDHSLGIVMSDELEALAQPPSFMVEDLCYGPVAVAQWFLDEAREYPFTRAIFISAIERQARPAGTISAYRWDHALPPEEYIQRCVVDAVTGVILLDNTLIVTEWMKALPAETVVIEVEPVEHAFGDEMSPEVARAYEEVRRQAMVYATDTAAVLALPEKPLGGGWTPKPVTVVAPRFA
jgi:Ni,Fe-hydrogenase maturation factor